VFETINQAIAAKMLGITRRPSTDDLNMRIGKIIDDFS